jgi:hypothetical protein
MKTPIERFEERFAKGNDCWQWMNSKGSGGYGLFCFKGRLQGAHRVSYQLYVGDIPKGMHVCHRCDNPSCVNPSHLFLGTALDNAHDRDKKGRCQSGENHYRAKLTEKQVKEIREKWANGARNIDLSREFGVDKRNISNIVYYHTWNG